MKWFGKEFKFNNFDIWHRGNFNPNDKSDTIHTHTKSNITDFPNSLPASGGVADGINIIDTRSVNDKPAALSTKRLTGYFKNRTAVGNPPVGASGTFVYILNVVGWSSGEGSGGWPIQLAVGTEGLAYRQAINADTWGTWAKINNTKDIPTKLSQLENDIGAGGGTNIIASPTEPANLTEGDWWIKEL